MKTLRKPTKPKRDLSSLLEGRSVCLVDDDRHQETLVRGILKGIDASLHFFDEARAALDFLDTDTVDLILSDIMMPGMDGWEMHAALRASGCNSATPVIFTTCLISEAQEDGMADLQSRCLTIAKPLSRASLARAVARVL